MIATPTIRLKPVVRFREFPFGTADDPSMRSDMADQPWENQARVVAYLRMGVILGETMGADLTDWFDRPRKANPIIDGKRVGGTTEMTDGTWFWYAGLVHFIEKYNVRVAPEFVQHAARQGWRVNKESVRPGPYECSYFGQPV